MKGESSEGTYIPIKISCKKTHVPSRHTLYGNKTGNIWNRNYTCLVVTFIIWIYKENWRILANK
jgi:hypothetical protein